MSTFNLIERESAQSRLVARLRAASATRRCTRCFEPYESKPDHLGYLCPTCEAAPPPRWMTDPGRVAWSPAWANECRFKLEFEGTLTWKDRRRLRKFMHNAQRHNDCRELRDYYVPLLAAVERGAA